MGVEKTLENTPENRMNKVLNTFSGRTPSRDKRETTSKRLPCAARSALMRDSQNVSAAVRFAQSSVTTRASRFASSASATGNDSVMPTPNAMMPTKLRGAHNRLLVMMRQYQ